MEKVSFAHMADGTAEDYRIISEATAKMSAPLADDLLALLQQTERVDMGFHGDSSRALVAIGHSRIS